MDFKAGDTIFEEGANAVNLYGLLEGEVKLSILFRDKIMKTDIRFEESIRTYFETIEKKIITDVIGPDSVFGWSCMIKPGVWTSTAQCATPVQALVLKAVEIKAVLDGSPNAGKLFMERLLEIVSRRLKNRTEKLIESWAEAFNIDQL